MENTTHDLIQQLAILERAASQLLNKELKPLQLNANNYFYILKLYDNPNIIQSDFNDLVNLNQSTVTRSINSLVDIGFVEKKIAEDRRSQYLSLTIKGEKLAEKLKDKVNNLNKELNFKVDKSSSFSVIKQLQDKMRMLNDISNSPCNK